MGETIFIACALMAVALAGSLLAGRLRVPALLLFLGIGMAIGSDGLGLVTFDDYSLARDVGIVALALIAFEGGLTTKTEQLRPVAKTAASLAVLGTLLTAIITGFAATWLFGLPLLEGLLLGSIIASTDVAAVFAMLRGSGLKSRLTRTLEGEAGSNDPVAILLVIGFIEWITQPGYGIGDMVVLFVSQLSIGAAVGIAVGMLAAWAMRSVELPTVGLYPVASLTAAGLAFGSADVLGGSGFLAVYLAGLALSRATIPAKRTISAFHDGLAWVSQLGLFLSLGLLVYPSQLGPILLEGTLLALILCFVSRPVASLIATGFSRLDLADRVVLGWAGLRGAVPVVLATFPVIAGVPDSLEFFNIIFFAVVLSLVLQGPTIEPLARRLGVTAVEPVLPEPIAEIGSSRRLGAEVLDFPVRDGDAAAGVRVRDLELPREAVVNVIVRGRNAIPPRGSTRVEAGDHLHVLVRREAAEEVAELMGRWRSGPLGQPLRRPREVRGSPPIFTTRPLSPEAVEGDVVSPVRVMGSEVVARLRTRRDRAGALLVLSDGRYAITGPVVAVGSRNAITEYARRRISGSDGDDRAWMQTVIGAVAVDAFE